MERTVSFACDLLKMLGGTLTLIHVAVLPAVGETGAASVPIDPTPLIQAGRKISENALKLVESNGCKADTILEMAAGNAGYRIVSVAQEKGFTLIVIHARGHSKITDLLVGSVCHTVAHRASCRVLVVRP
jgi:nucleotide-binding universal stress UspA family protein